MSELDMKTMKILNQLNEVWLCDLVLDVINGWVTIMGQSPNYLPRKFRKTDKAGPIYYIEAPAAAA